LIGETQMTDSSISYVIMHRYVSSTSQSSRKYFNQIDYISKILKDDDFTSREK